MIDVAADFAQLAAAVGAGSAELTPAQLTERDSYVREAVGVLQRAAEAGYKNFAPLKEDPRFAPLLKDQEFLMLVEKKPSG